MDYRRKRKSHRPVTCETRYFVVQTIVVVSVVVRSCSSHVQAPRHQGTNSSASVELPHSVRSLALSDFPNSSNSCGGQLLSPRSPAENYAIISFLLELAHNGAGQSQRLCCSQQPRGARLLSLHVRCPPGTAAVPLSCGLCRSPSCKQCAHSRLVNESDSSHRS